MRRMRSWRDSDAPRARATAASAPAEANASHSRRFIWAWGLTFVLRGRNGLGRQALQLVDVADDLDDATGAAHHRLRHDVAGFERQELRVLRAERRPHGGEQGALR